MKKAKYALISKVLLVLYLVLATYFLVISRGSRLSVMPYWECIKSGINFMPLSSISEYLKIAAVNWKVAVKNFGLNLIAFIPLGVLLPRIWEKPKKYSSVVWRAMLIVLFFELLQLFTTRGICDIDDLIFGYIGITLGYFIQRIFFAFLQNRATKKS